MAHGYPRSTDSFSELSDRDVTDRSVEMTEPHDDYRDSNPVSAPPPAPPPTPAHRTLHALSASLTGEITRPPRVTEGRARDSLSER